MHLLPCTEVRNEDTLSVAVENLVAVGGINARVAGNNRSRLAEIRTLTFERHIKQAENPY